MDRKIQNEAQELVAQVNAFRVAVVRGVEAVQLVQRAIEAVTQQLDLEITFEPEGPPNWKDYLVLGTVGAIEGGAGGAVLGAFLGGLFGDVRAGMLLGAGIGAAFGGAIGVNKVMIGWRVGVRMDEHGSREIVIQRIR